MKNHLADALKESRQKYRFSHTQAAELAEVSNRTWRAYEAPICNDFIRTPSQSVIRCFYYRSGIPMPSKVKEFFDDKKSARVLSIFSLKGGVGKSPITVDIAACLVKRGCKVAIVTYDVVYEGMVEAGERPAPDTLVSKIDFYGRADVFFSKAEFADLKKKIRDLIKDGTPNERRLLEYDMGSTIESMQEKLNSPMLFRDLKDKYDFIFLDLNRMVELVRSHSDVVAIILDSNCAQSIDNAESLFARLQAAKSKARIPKCYGLITHDDIGGVSKELEEYCGGLDLGSDVWGLLEDSRFAIYKRRESILKKIKALPMLRLYTHLTNAHEVVIERYNSTRSLENGYAYFHSILDVAPFSHAADEVERLTEELIDLRA